MIGHLGLWSAEAEAVGREEVPKQRRVNRIGQRAEAERACKLLRTVEEGRGGPLGVVALRIVDAVWSRWVSEKCQGPLSGNVVVAGEQSRISSESGQSRTRQVDQDERAAHVDPRQPPRAQLDQVNPTGADFPSEGLNERGAFVGTHVQDAILLTRRIETGGGRARRISSPVQRRVPGIVKTEPGLVGDPSR